MDRPGKAKMQHIIATIKYRHTDGTTGEVDFLDVGAECVLFAKFDAYKAREGLVNVTTYAVDHRVVVS